MKTISMKINPAFKLAQPLPMLPNVPPPQKGSAATGAAKFAPPSGDLRQKMTALAVCAMNVSKSFNAPAVRLTN
jgi:hypothetical protein